MDSGNKPVRILHVLGTLNMGGAESRVMDLYRNIDRSKVQFDFAIHDRSGAGQVREKDYYEEEARQMGASVFVMPRFTGKNLLSYRRAWENMFAEHSGWAAVEGHMTSTAAIYLPAAKRAGIPVTIAHARSAGVDPGLRGLATRLLRVRLADQCDYMFSCSTPASVSVFGKKAVREGRVMYVPNALDTRAFLFDEEKRRAIRQELGIPDDAFVIGHVGRFDAMKNQIMFAELAEHLHSACPEKTFRFLMVGAGPLMDTVKEAFAQKGLGEWAVFAGRCDRARTIGMYQAFDLFCFPSLYEGLPGTVIEAQAAGLRCLISDTITDEVLVTGLAEALSLGQVSVWADKVMSICAKSMPERAQNMPAGSKDVSAGAQKTPAGEAVSSARMDASRMALARLDEAGFDVRTQAERMMQWYLEKAGCIA